LFGVIIFGEVSSNGSQIMTLIKEIRKAQGWKGWVRDIAIACGVALIIMAFIKPTIVQERSMQPTLYANNYILLSRQAYLFSEPRPGDIIVFNSTLPLDENDPDNGNKLLIKRVIAVEGDTLAIIDGNVYINDELLIEPFIYGTETPGYIPNKVIPDGTVFVMGDNRRQSVDSRSERLGVIDVREIVGRAFFRLYPFNAIGRIR
jgi:signal peptidase I